MSLSTADSACGFDTDGDIGSIEVGTVARSIVRDSFATAGTACRVDAKGRDISVAAENPSAAATTPVPATHHQPGPDAASTAAATAVLDSPLMAAGGVWLSTAAAGSFAVSEPHRRSS
jgi:hypothetical protein